MAAAARRLDESPGGGVLDPDADLVARLQTGDAAAFRLLSERHLGRVFGVARRMLKAEAEAEEVAQETFLRLWRDRAKWRPGAAKLSTWLMRVATNLAIDRIRKAREAPLDDAIEPADPTPGAFAALQEKDVAARIQGALQKLPERQRAAIVLVHYEETPQADAAAAMEVSLDALESLLARGRRNLKAMLAGEREHLLEIGDHDA